MVLVVYLNYPNSRVAIHHNPLCRHIQQNDKPNQRVCTLTPATLAAELARFEAGEYPFAATPEANDLWLHLDLGEEIENLKALGKVLACLGRRYAPLEDARISECC